MFKAIKVLNRKQFTNPQGNDKDVKKITSPNPKHHNETF